MLHIPRCPAHRVTRSGLVLPPSCADLAAAGAGEHQFHDPLIAEMARLASLTDAQMPYTLLAPAQYLQAAAGAAYASSVAATDVSVAPQYVLPPNTITTVGQTLRLHAGGVFSTTGTPTLILGFYYGGVAGVALAATAATTTASGVTNLPWSLDWFGTVRAVGSAGTIIGFGSCNLATSATAAANIPIPNATPQTALTIDTTVPKAITVGATWGTSSASNTLTVHQFTVELLN